MRRAAIEAAHVNIGAGGLRESLEEIFEEFNGEIADARGFDFCLDDAMPAATEVDCGGREGFVHGHQEISGAEDSFFRAQRFLYGLAERDADVFDGVVLVDVEVALGGDGEIERTVTRNEIEHVIEETDAGGDFGLAAAIDQEAEADVGFLRFAMDGGRATHTSFFQMRRISRRRVFISAGVPMVMRTKPGPMSFERSRRRMPLRSSLAKRVGPVGPKLARRKFPPLGKVRTPR